MKRTSRFYVALVFLFLYAPILVLIFFSFNSSESTGLFTGFSLRWYQELFRQPEILNALSNTLIVALISSVLATLMGTAAAIGLYFMKKWSRTTALTVNNVPMLNPDIVTGISLMLLFVFAGSMLGLTEILGFWTLLIAHITFNIPYVILSVLPKLRQVDYRLYEAAQDLGCPPGRAFFKVILPEILPGIVTGFVMAITLSVDDFVISYFTSGPNFQTLPILIFSMTKKRVKPTINALSTLLFFCIFFLLIVINLVQNREEKKKYGKGRK